MRLEPQIKRITGYEEIKNIMRYIKSQKKGFITNFYFGEARCNLFIDKSLLFYVNMQECIFILRKDHNFYHVYYIAANKDMLAKSLQMLAKKYSNDIFVSDIIGAKPVIDDISSTCEELGFEKYARLYRMSRTKNLDEPQQLDRKIEYAASEHIEQMLILFEKYFDPYSEQIPMAEEMQKWIDTQNILIIAENKNAIGFLIFEINGITSYLRYWFVHPEHRDKKIGSALLRRFFHESRAAKRQLFWVLENNENAIARYKRYGFEPEQLFDQIMIRRQT